MSMNKNEMRKDIDARIIDIFDQIGLFEALIIIQKDLPKSQEEAWLSYQKEHIHD